MVVEQLGRTNDLLSEKLRDRELRLRDELGGTLRALASQLHALRGSADREISRVRAQYDTDKAEVTADAKRESLVRPQTSLPNLGAGRVDTPSSLQGGVQGWRACPQAQPGWPTRGAPPAQGSSTCYVSVRTSSCQVLCASSGRRWGQQSASTCALGCRSPRQAPLTVTVLSVRTSFLLACVILDHALSPDDWTELTHTATLRPIRARLTKPFGVVLFILAFSPKPSFSVVQEPLQRANPLTLAHTLLVL